MSHVSQFRLDPLYPLSCTFNTSYQTLTGRQICRLLKECTCVLHYMGVSGFADLELIFHSYADTSDLAL